MIKLPFKRETFAREMKPKISGNNLTLEFDNLQSTLSKVAVEFYAYFSQKLYDKIVSKTAATGEKENELNEQALDYLQRAMLHFTLYQHTIYLIANIKNDGITVKKEADNTTIYKYQQDQLENKLISDGWFWLNQLFALLNANADAFEDWKDSDQKKAFDDLPITINDFQKWVGVSDESFMIFAMWLIREVWNECVLSRFTAEKVPELSFLDKIRRAVCYDVMARACVRLAYHCLPEPIRLDINNEMGKNHAAQADKHIRERVAGVFEQKALSYWNGIDTEISSKKAELAQSNISTETYKPRKISENEAFCV